MNKIKLTLADFLPERPIYEQTNSIPTEFANLLWYEDDMVDEADDFYQPIQSIFDQLSSPICKNILNNKSGLYAHQIEALQKLKEHVDNFDVRKGLPDIHLIVLPTGTGKSTIIGLAPYFLKAESVLIVTPSVTITRQLKVDLDVSTSNILLKRNVVPSYFFNANLKNLPQPTIIEKTKDLQGSFSNDRLVIVNAQKLGSTSTYDIEKLPKGFDVVIIDEAHHYPADTWQKIVDHFVQSKKVFLTATPKRRDGDILGKIQPELICYEMSRKEAIAKGIIREIAPSPCGDIFETKFKDQCITTGKRILEILLNHNQQDNSIDHQAMIITCTTAEAAVCVKSINDHYGDVAIEYTSRSDFANFTKFQSCERKIILVCGKLLEGFDRPQVSVVGILRNISTSSHVLFNQFIGRCVRKCHPKDPVIATVVWHVAYRQETNYHNLIGQHNEELVTEIPPEDEIDE